MKATPFGTRITVLLCENSGWKAASGLPGDLALRGVDFVKIPCSGRVDAALLLSLLEKGSEGVLAVGCPKDCCAYVTGSDWAEKRVKATRTILREAGLDERRVDLALVSAMDTHRLLEAIQDFARCLHDHSGS